MASLKQNILVIGYLIINCSFVNSQYADTINIKLKDTLRGYTDYVLEVRLSRKDAKIFKFPDNYYVSEGFAHADLFIMVEKWADNKFHHILLN